VPYSAAPSTSCDSNPMTAEPTPYDSGGAIGTPSSSGC
jgi:hypothetical protein